MSDLEKEQCLALLDSFIDEIETLIAFVAEPRSRTKLGKYEAREMLATLKQRLGTESRRVSMSPGRERMGTIERDYYSWAVQEANARLCLRANSVPGPHWVDELYGIQIDFSFHAGHLRDQLAK